MNMLQKWFHNFNKRALHAVIDCSVAAVTPAGVINVSTTICSANLDKNSYLVDVYLKMLFPSGFISHMLLYARGFAPTTCAHNFSSTASCTTCFED